MTFLDFLNKYLYIYNMEYEKTLLDLLERVKTLEERVRTLENSQISDMESIKTGKKYRKLSNYLLASNNQSIILKFNEIESIIGFKLPESAKKYRPFWANTTTHSIALSWLSVGYETVEVNMDLQLVVFEKQE